MPWTILPPKERNSPMTSDPKQPIEEKEEPERILLVDDNSTNLQVLFQTLDGRGYKLFIAKSGEDALKTARTTQPALILLDIMMPGIDGYETCQKLKEDPTTREAAIIFLSALDDTKDKVRGLDLGAVDFITKPFQGEEVIARVNTHLTIYRLKRELQAANVRMKNDLDAAARLQQSLLPQTSPDVQGARFTWHYKPCDELAGDILNVFQLDEKHVALYVADVSGHGVAASLLSVAISRVLSPAASRTSLLVRPIDGSSELRIVTPADVAFELNNRFPMEDSGDRLFTMVYGVLNLETREFRYVSAGHPPVIRWSTQAQPETIDAKGKTIGMMPDVEYEEKVVKLKKGDRLCIYSDGIPEAMNPGFEEFGDRRLLESIVGNLTSSLEDCISGLLKGVEEWCGTKGLNDDVSLVALEII